MRTINAILSVALAACAFVVFGSGVTPYDQPVLVDTSASAGGVIASSSSSTAYPASKAFDGAWSTISSDRWLAYINPNKNDYTGGLTGETPAYVTYKFNAATKVNVLRIRIPNDKDYSCSDRAPKAWTFSGSSDNSTWTTLDTRSGVTWVSGEVTKEFFFSNQTAYEYYKFVCTEIGGVNDYLQIYELQFLCAPDMTALVCSSELTFPAAPATALENFPILLRISPTAIDGFSYAACPNASHLWFTDDGYNLLPFEVDTWEEGGTSLVWVSVPSFSRSTTITMHWAGDTANVPDEIPASREVWTRAGYRAVWHFSGSAAESVTNLAATAVGSPTYNGNASYPGPLGKTLWLNGSSHLYFANNPSWATIGENSTLTISCWARATAGNYARMISSMSDWKNTTGYELTTQSSSSEITVGSSGTGSNGSQFQTQIAPGVNTAWQHFTATYSGTTATLYVNGASAKSATLNPVVAPTQGLALGSISGTTGSNLWTGGLDEVRIRAAASTAAWIAEECATMTNAAYVSYGKATADASAPVVATPAVTRDAGGGFTVTVGISQNVPTSVCCVVGNVTNVMTTSDSELPMTYSATLSGFAADTTYACVVSATSAGGSAVSRACPMTLYTGDLAVEKLADASESTLAPGVFRITRADTAYDLPVFYTVGGTATAGQTYEALSGTAIIPAGTNAVDVVVVPILDQQTTSNTTVTITLDAGLYGIDAEAGSAELTIANLVAPAGFNLWVAPSNGLASVGTNWSEGHAPTASENILFDGRFSTANCEWDAGATVASWTQTNGYTGTVTFDTEFPDYSGATFTQFTISGDCGIYSGKWSCRGNYNNYGVSVTPMNTTKTAKRWCLNVAVGGAMTVASGTAITATGRGYGYTNGIASPAYGGYAWGGGSSPYGSIKEPFEPGLGALAQGDQRNKISGIGGGAIKLVITGTLTLDGSIVALGTADQNIARSGGTGGSIWISANQISGEGKIDASGPTGIGNDQIVGTGSGGRIALYTQSPLAFPMANVACSGTGYGATSWQWNSRVSGPGTIYVYDPTQTDGTLYVKQSTTVSTQNTKWTGTPVMGDLALDAVVISGCASLRIPEGASLTLPSLAAVTTSNSGSGSAGLVYDGGTLNIGSGDQTLKENVAFSSPTAFAFPGNLTLETGAKLGSLNSMYGTAAHCYDQTFTVSVAGDLTIPTGASAGATRCCALTAGSTGRYTAAHGGQSLYLAAEARTNGFDSVLNPSMPGGSMNVNFPAGGAFTLTVGGTLTLEGSMTADGGGARGNDSAYDGASAGAGGTINVTAGALAGEGKISADGGCGRYCYAGGAGGGRIAVRLTGNKAVFSDYWVTNFFSRGMSFSVDRNGKASSAGTVYLQAAGDAESAGTVVIRNDFALQSGATNNLATTRYPGNGDGCDTPAALRKTSLFVAGAAHVELTDTMRSAALEIENGSAIDLAGKKFTVNSAKVGGEHLMPGTYTPENLAEFLVDSASGGELVVTGGGLQIHLR